jgi:hypothetical protein
MGVTYSTASGLWRSADGSSPSPADDLLTPDRWEVDMNSLDTKWSDQHVRHGGPSGHAWMMIACCIPILVVAITLVATGVVGYGLTFATMMCTAMMAMMMRMMSGGSEQK